MFFLICGEDISAARSHIYSLKTGYRAKNARVFEVPPAELESLVQTEQDFTLFGEPVVYITQGIIAYWGKRKLVSAERITVLQQNDAITVIDWEPGRSLYDLKMKSAPFVKEFKPPASLFEIRNLCVPGKRSRFIQSLRVLEKYHEPFLIFSLLHKHIRLVLLLKSGQPAGKISPYVKSQAAQQAALWETAKLASLYAGLAKIDQSQKSGGTSLSLMRSLEVLACYYL